MPLYEYFCSDCNTRFDALRPMTQADEPIACSECTGEQTARVLSLFFARGGSDALVGSGPLAGTGGCGCGNGMCGCGHSHN